MLRPMATGALGIGAIVFFSKELHFARRVIGGFGLTNVFFIAAGRLILLTLAGRLHRTGAPLRRIVVVGAGNAARQFGEKIAEAGWGLELAGYVSPGLASEPCLSPDLGAVQSLADTLDRLSIDDVVLADPNTDTDIVHQVMRACEEVGVAIHIASGFFAAERSTPHLETFGGIPMLTFSTRPYNPIALGVKRSADMVLGAVLLVLSAIPMACMAVAIKLNSRGPVLFRQRRCGLYGREFIMLKFRTMIADAEARRPDLETANEMTGPVFKMRNDPRITGVGKWLRRYSLDELPQLWHVINGEMSLIGPRPPLPSEVAQYERWQRRRLSMRPGLTCIWQVTDRNLATFERWMEYDLQYIDRWSLWLDLKIAFLTVPAVFKGTGL